MWMSSDIAIGICAYLNKESLESSRLASKTFNAVVKRHFLANIPNICSGYLRIIFNADDTVNCYIVFDPEDDNIPRYFKDHKEEDFQSFLFTLPTCDLAQIPRDHFLLRLFNSGKINFEQVSFEAELFRAKEKPVSWRLVLHWNDKNPKRNPTKSLDVVNLKIGQKLSILHRMESQSDYPPYKYYPPYLRIDSHDV
ncbi:hypothetical protein Ddc_12102 [Ditylenchus destructor]|nr:hypothetical protein Ddc_12102 [Ditylenchus destructor]